MKVYYCKSKKKTGKPIIIDDGDSVKYVKEIYIKCNHCGHYVGEVKYNNSNGKAKRSGATTVLELYD